MAQAKITINKAQAQKLGLLVHKKKPVYPIMYEPKSGVNLRETKAGEVIEVPDGVDLYNLRRFYAAGYFDVVEGSLEDGTKLMSVSIVDDQFISLNFNGAIYTDGISDEDMIIKVNQDIVPGITIGQIQKASATDTVSIGTGIYLRKGDTVSVEITETGAAKILNESDEPVIPLTQTVLYFPATEPTNVGSSFNITAFSFLDADNTALSADAVGVVNGGGFSIAVTVPAGTDVTNLVATFTASEGSTVHIDRAIQESGASSADFTAPVVYTVEQGNRQGSSNWTVTVTIAP